MNLKNGISNYNSIWIKLTGQPKLFSMENRAFNYVSIISFVLLALCFLLDICIAQFLMAGVIVGLIIILTILYYFSRFKRRFSSAIVVYAACTYITLILNFYCNSGINGPTLFLFFLTFHLLSVISKPKLYPLWITLHLLIVSVLLISQYIHPNWVSGTYNFHAGRYIDFFISYVVAIIFIFSLTSYLRNYFNYEHRLAGERAIAIALQNEHILQQNQVLTKINDEKNKLFSIISHDLRSPLDSIRGYLELLSEELLTEEEKTSIHDELLTQTKYTSELLLNILYWSKTQMQGVTVNLKPVNLKSVIDKTANLKIATAAKKGVKLVYNIPFAAEVIADEDMLSIVLRNLINNAIKFTPEGGEIVISATATNKDVTISVSDTGIGIPEEKRMQMFTFRTRSTFGTNNEKGIGMGLMLCKEFMDYQHGTIDFKSGDKAGTVFYITLPKPNLQQ